MSKPPFWHPASCRACWLECLLVSLGIIALMVYCLVTAQAQIVMQSPNGQKWRLTMSNNGALLREPILDNVPTEAIGIFFSRGKGRRTKGQIEIQLPMRAFIADLPKNVQVRVTDSRGAQTVQSDDGGVIAVSVAKGAVSFEVVL